ncbi:MAG: Smr protein/MutS2 [Acidobacteria bacterium]|nr:Smr protein/MutS2 [Acidobacteriota bacterium]
MARREPPPGPDDADAWARAMAGVKPVAPATPRVVPARRPPRVPPEEAEAEGSAPAAGPFEVLVEDERVTGRASDAPRALLKALGRGEPPPEARLDLHGFTRDTALREVTGFVVRSRAAGRRSVLIITGRGEVLRAAIAEWLARSPAAAHVLAFSSAPPRLGGPGAVAVLLRRSGRRGT